MQESDDYECTGCTTAPGYEPNYCDTHAGACGGGGNPDDDLKTGSSGDKGRDEDWLHTQPFADWFTGTSDLSLIDSWDGAQNIDPAEWQQLLAKIGANVHKTPKILLFLKAVNYDTPFFDKGRFFGLSKLNGTGCIYGECYDRSELNYIAQGELWAAIGVPKQVGKLIVLEWKQTKSFPPFDLQNPVPVTNGTFEMFDVGYDYYQENYSTTP